MKEIKHDRKYENKHLLPHPQTRLLIILAIVILMGFLPYFAQNHRSEEEINHTVEFLKAGGYEEDFYTKGYYVEFASDSEKIVVEYMMEDAVEIYAVTQIGAGTYTPQASQSALVFKQYNINFVTMPADKIYERLKEYGYNSYKVYLHYITSLH